MMGRESETKASSSLMQQGLQGLVLAWQTRQHHHFLRTQACLSRGTLGLEMQISKLSYVVVRKLGKVTLGMFLVQGKGTVCQVSLELAWAKAIFWDAF